MIPIKLVSTWAGDMISKTKRCGEGISILTEGLKLLNFMSCL
jgi:hypothetical protein